jgi:uncharacterized protein YjbI with pentapeptide repeats
MERPSSLTEYFDRAPACSVSVHQDEIPTEQREEMKAGARQMLRTDAEGYWHCPHPEIGLEETDRCLFHAPSEVIPVDRSPSDELRQVLELPADGASREQRRQRKQFIDASFDRLTLEDEVISGSDNFPLDLRLVDIDRIQCDSATLDLPIDLRNGDIGRATATNATLHRVFAQDTDFEQVELDHATIERAYFERAEAELLRLYFTDLDYANFHQGRFDRANFVYGTFGEMGFFDTEFGIATFAGASFNNAYFWGAEAEYLNLRRTDGRKLEVLNTEAVAASFGASDFRRGRVNGSIFDWSSFARVDWTIGAVHGAALGVVTFDDARFGRFGGEEVRFNRSMSFEDAVIEESLVFEPVTVAYTRSDAEDAVRAGSSDTDSYPTGTTDGGRPVATSSDGRRADGYVSFRGSELAGGRLGQPEDGILIYDFGDATLHDIHLDSVPNGNLVDRLRILRTEFEGFDVSKQSALDLDAVDYTLHRLYPGAAEDIAIYRSIGEIAPGLHPALDVINGSGKSNTVDFDAVERPVGPGETITTALRKAEQRLEDDNKTADQHDSVVEVTPTLEELETTYLKAKDGADTVGASTASGRFFEKERTYRRYDHWRGFHDSTAPLRVRLRRGSEWVRNAALAVTTGYGERPWRVIGSSLAIIVLFGGLYWALSPPLGGLAGSEGVDYLVFSFQSFITFLIGSRPRSPSLTLRVLGAFEGFVGAFFVALFVFALTRQVQR